MTDVDTALMQQILDIAERQRETHVHHDRQPDDLATGSEILERVVFRHPEALRDRLAPLNRIPSDNAPMVTARLAAPFGFAGKTYRGSPTNLAQRRKHSVVGSKIT